MAEENKSSKRQLPREGNVIYANFGRKTRVDTPPPETAGAEVRRVHGDSRAQAFIRSIYLDSTDSGRVSRGKAYARNGNVVSFAVNRDRVIVGVAGSQLEPFNVAVTFPRRSTADLEEVTTTLLENPGALRAAREGDFSPQLIDVLFAEDTSSVRVACDCPDRNLVCKHGVAALEHFAERVERDPVLLFNLRGLNFVQLEEAMRQEAVRRASEPDQEDTDRFWNGSEVPELPQPKIAPAIDESDLDLLHKAMRTVSYTSIDELRAVADIEELYDRLVDR